MRNPFSRGGPGHPPTAIGEGIIDDVAEVPMITLYQVEWCGYCHRVREALTELGLDYTVVNVAASRPHRREVIELSGQQAVPVITDGDLVIADSARIVAYLNETYGDTTDPEERERHRRSAAFRTVKVVDDPPSTPSAV